MAPAQTSQNKPGKSPRALGLVELLNGNARLVPVVILIDGQYFDASAYKAMPVPMALWGDTVYEAFKTGVSQGLFTVKTALENPETHAWLGEGKWVSASELKHKIARKEASPIPRGMEDDDSPPVLRHEGPAKPKPPQTPAPVPASPANPATPPPPPVPSTPSVPAEPPTPAVDQAHVAPLPVPPPPPDQDIPVLKRGRPAPRASNEAEPPTPPITGKHTNAGKPSSPAAAMQIFPAISAVGGPEPQSYSYPMNPEEQQQFRKQLLAMAADDVRARAKLLAGEQIQPLEKAKAPARRRSLAKPPQPDFTDVQLHVFDLNISNEPVVILEARARLPQSAKDDTAGLQYIVTVVARQDVNTDWHKVFANVTDTTHLDVIPEMDLIDAVDVDGDGRGELLFREVADQGTAYAVYRVIGNELYPLFQGVPGS